MHGPLLEGFDPFRWFTSVFATRIRWLSCPRSVLLCGPDRTNTLN